MSDFKIISPRLIQTDNGFETVSNTVYNIESFIYGKGGVSKVDVKAYKSETALQNNASPVNSVPPIFLDPEKVTKAIAYLIEQRLEEEGHTVINNAILRTPWPEPPDVPADKIERIFLYSYNALQLVEDVPLFSQKLDTLGIVQITDINGKWAYVEYLDQEDRDLLELPKYNTVFQTISQYNELMGIS